MDSFADSQEVRVSRPCPENQHMAGRVGTIAWIGPQTGIGWIDFGNGEPLRCLAPDECEPSQPSQPAA